MFACQDLHLHLKDLLHRMQQSANLEATGSAADMPLPYAWPLRLDLQM